MVKVICKGRCGHRFYNSIGEDALEKIKNGELPKKRWNAGCPKCDCRVIADIIIEETKEKVIFT